MLDTVHIKLEKITGLKGIIEGAFQFLGDSHPEKHLPIVYLGPLDTGYEFIHEGQVVKESMERKGFIFRQGNKKIYLIPNSGFDNYKEHFEYGVNFLIKEWSYGRGEGIKFTGSPN